MRKFTKYPNTSIMTATHNYNLKFAALSNDEVNQIETEVAKMSNEDLLRSYAKHWFDFNSPGTSSREDDIGEIYKAEILARMR